MIEIKPKLSGKINNPARVQNPTDFDHHKQHAEYGDHRGQDLGQALVQGGGNGVDVVGDKAHDLTVRCFGHRTTAEVC